MARNVLPVRAEVMTMMRNILNDEVDDAVIDLRLATNDVIVRRQLLWLRAKEKEDEDEAAYLLDVEPAIREWAFAIEIEGDALPTYKQRAEWYADRWHDHYDASVRRLRASRRLR